jgi:hypothetical protein
MMLKLHVPILNELDMWSLVEKNPKETGVLEKHNTKVSLWEKNKIVKIMFFSIGAVSTLLAIWSIGILKNQMKKQYNIEL